MAKKLATSLNCKPPSVIFSTVALYGVLDFGMQGANRWFFEGFYRELV